MAVKTKAAIQAEITTLLADNSSNLITAANLRTILNDITDSYDIVPYKKYVALLSQTGTSAPVATVLENSLSGSPTISRVATGIYAINLTGEFVQNKTYWPDCVDTFASGNGNCIFKPIYSGVSIVGYYFLIHESEDYMLINTVNTLFVATELSTLITDNILALPELKVYA